MKETKEFRDYSRWAKTKQFYVSSELLPFTDHFDPACQPCLGSVNTKEKAAVQQLRFDLKDKAVGTSNSIIYFTNMINGCFGAVLASTYNKEVIYQKAMLMGKQTVFQFQVENGQVRICSERTMWID